MTTSTSSGSPRRPRRGGSRRSGPQRRSRNQDAPQAPVKKSGFFDKILSFFKGNSKAPSTTPRPNQQEGRTARRTEPSSPRTTHEVTGPRLYVGNLSYDTTESDLFELFNGVGKVQNAEIVANKHTHRSKGFAFVQMQSLEEAKRAVEELHDKEFMGRKLVVSGARELGHQT